MKQTQLSVDLAPHEQQLGKYRLVAKLGQGGMGTVYLALASGLGSFRKLLVVKELRHDLPWRESSLSMFMDEAQLAARLDHPNVLQTFEAGEADGRYFLAMEYLDGQPLSTLIDHGIPLELHVHILCEVLQGLQYAHDLTDYDGSRLHVVHRDVSPQNVFVTHHGQVKVVDFGVAKANNGSNITSPGVFKGKFAYAAPEQLFGRPVDGRCDVFAVGVMLWEAIAGRRFGVPKPTVDAFRVRTQGLEPRISQVNPDVDPLLAEICDHALMVDPLERVESADALRARLQEWLLLQGEHIQAKQLAEFMRGRFSEERLVRQRIIERAMIDAGASQSTISTLPRELFDRESGTSPRVGANEHDSQHVSTSGISPAQAQPAQRTEGDSVHSQHSAPKLSYADESVHTGNARRVAAQMKQGSRLSSAAALLIVAGAVFALTYQLSRKATEPLSAPQLHSTAAPDSNAAKHATESTSSAATASSASDEARLKQQRPGPTSPAAREAAYPVDSPQAAREPTLGSTPDPALDSSRDARDPALGSSRDARSSALDGSRDMRDALGSTRDARSSALDGSRDMRDALGSTRAAPSSALEGSRDSADRAARDSAIGSSREARGNAARPYPTRDARGLGAREAAIGGTRDARERTERGAGQAMPAHTREARDPNATREPTSPASRARALAAPQRTAAAPAPAPGATSSREPTARPPARELPGVSDDAAARMRSPMERGPAPKTRSGGRDTGMGSDLRQLRNGGPMRIDTEDPYK